MPNFFVVKQLVRLKYLRFYCKINDIGFEIEPNSKIERKINTVNKRKYAGTAQHNTCFCMKQTEDWPSGKQAERI